MGQNFEKFKSHQLKKLQQFYFNTLFHTLLSPINRIDQPFKQIYQMIWILKWQLFITTLNSDKTQTLISKVVYQTNDFSYISSIIIISLNFKNNLKVNYYVVDISNLLIFRLINYNHLALKKQISSIGQNNRFSINSLASLNKILSFYKCGCFSSI